MQASIIISAAIAVFVAGGSVNSQITYSNWQPAQKLTQGGVDPNCILVFEDCPVQWFWAPTGTVITCGAGLTGWRAPAWPTGDQFFCCAGSGRWRYVMSGGLVFDIHTDCN